MQNKLAKSRLKKKEAASAKFVPYLEKKFQTNKPGIAAISNSKTDEPKPSEKNYKSALPSLFLGSFFTIVCIALMNIVQPYTVANIPFKNMFLPFLAPVFLAMFFIFSYIFLNSKKGFFVASGVTCVVWTLLVVPNLAIWIGIGLAVWYGVLIKFA